MSEHDLDPLPPDIAHLLSESRELAPVPDESRARILTRARATLFGPGSPPDGSGGSNGPNGGPDGAPGAATAGSGGLGAKAIVAAVSLTVGATAGVIGHATLAPEPEPIRMVVEVPVPRALADVAPETEVAPDASPGVTGSEPNAPSAASTTVTPEAEPVRSPRRSIEAERDLVAQAQTALGRGRPTDALRALAAHARAYPRGTHTEEREALRVRALTAAGRSDDARRAAQRFVERYPNSIFHDLVAPTLDAP